jgi:proton glutamate symport protein
LALVAGIGFGLLASATGEPTLRRVATGVEPIGTVWVNLIRMVVIPLVVAAVIGSVAGLGDAGRLGRLGGRAILIFLGTGLVGIVGGLALAAVALPLAPLSAEASAALRTAAAAQPTGLPASGQSFPGFVQFLTGIVPANPVKAAADGALLPVLVFSVLFGLALARLDGPRRATLVGLADAVAATVFKLLEWFMALAPLGVACLAAPVAARLGWGMLASLVAFLGAVVLGCVLMILLVLAPLVRFAARLPVGPFARTVAPSFALGFSATSSMAALPALLKAAVEELRISPAVANFVIPLGATINRPASALYQAVALVFVARFYGVALGPAQLAAAVATMLLMTLSVPAMPRSSVLSLAPVLLAAGVPVDGLGLLLGVDQVPDMFRTATNVAGHLTAAAAIARGEGESLSAGG